MAQTAVRSNGSFLQSVVLRHSDLLVSVGAVLVVGMMIVPMPHWLLDVLLVANMGITLTILLVTAYTTDALKFSVFPSMLLVVTLFRLGINISATRLILLHANAGAVIDSFGQFVVGGNYVVGIVVFLILVVIQFVVITNGAGRVAEVAARFTLDSMPGKQMAIDADLNAGLIDEHEARARRQSVAKEADFYGAMDGASKFVRGDAIAAVVMILVNILGGFVIGITQRGMDLMGSLQTYTLLTVGEGIVTQIPALLMSTGTGIIITRASSEAPLGHDLAAQSLAHPRVLGTVAVMLGAMALVPGLPKLPFFVMAAATGLFAVSMGRDQAAAAEVAADEAPGPGAAEQTAELLPVDPLELEIGYGLIPLADPSQGGALLDRITTLRRHIAADLGFIVPPLRVRDNMQLRPNGYCIKLSGVAIARGEIVPHQMLAINPGHASAAIRGTETADPAFGLPAVWIPEAQKIEAEMGGYSVVDAATVLITHLGEVVRRNAHEILGRQDVQSLLDAVRTAAPVVVDELTPKLLSISEIHRVLQGLLAERVSVRDLQRILALLADAAPATREIDQLVEHVRRGLARSITAANVSDDGVLRVFTLAPNLEETVLTSIRPTSEGPRPVLDPAMGQRLLAQIREAARRLTAAGATPIVLCSPPVRRATRQLTQQTLPDLVVLSHTEVAPGTNVQSESVVTLEHEIAA